MDSFKGFTLNMFRDFNNDITQNFDSLDSTNLDKSLNNILKQEDHLREIDSLTDNLVNKIIYLQQSQLIEDKLKEI